jgi:hypothetical protein
MLSLTTLVAVSLLGTAATASTQPLASVNQPEQVAILEIAPEPTTEMRFICKGCNENENRTLAFLQDQGIKDKNAIAVVMGNIRQESTFVPNICEGGSRTSYTGCRRGGYGLIQFTSIDRFEGLGRHAQFIKKDPSTLEAQLSYIVTEPQWKRIESSMKAPGKSIDRYMNYSYSWIGWGIKGARTSYAYDYANRLDLAQVPTSGASIDAASSEGV